MIETECLSPTRAPNTIAEERLPLTRMSRVRAVALSLLTPPEKGVFIRSHSKDKKRGWRAVTKEVLGRPVRDLIDHAIPPWSRVIDIGCGRGTLAFRLARKNCFVHGIDIDCDTIATAQRQKTETGISKIQFSEADAATLSEISDQSFDYAVVSLVLHCLPENTCLKILREAKRVARRIIIADYTAQRRENFAAHVVFVLEIHAGHSQNFKIFSEGGGIERLLEKAGLQTKEEHLTSSGLIKVILAEKRK